MENYYNNKEELAEKFKKCQDTFIALGDSTRQKILLILLDNNKKGLRVNDIAEKTPLSRPAVSHHLKVLKNAHIVAVNRIGTKNYYHINCKETSWKQLVELSNDIYKRIEKCKNKDI